MLAEARDERLVPQVDAVISPDGEDTAPAGRRTETTNELHALDKLLIQKN
jgi:hypothetical protein